MFYKKKFIIHTQTCLSDKENALCIMNEFSLIDKLAEKLDLAIKLEKEKELNEPGTD